MPFQFKTTGIALISALIGTAFTIGLYENDKNKTTVLTEESHLKSKIEKLERENKDLTREKDALAESLQKLRLVQNNFPVKNQVAVTTTIAKTIAPNSPDQIQRDFENYKNEKKAEAFQRWFMDSIKNSKDFNIGNEMQRRFDAEEINPTWALEQEQKISNLFVDHEELRGTALKETKCRSSQCEIQISISDSEQANQIMEKAYKALQALSKDTMVIASHNIEKGFTTLYVSQSEKGFDFN